MFNQFRKERGVALISVLVIAAILSWVLSYFIDKTKDNIELVENARSRVLAEIDADSAIDRTMFMHFSGMINRAQGGNYYGKAFKLQDDVEVRVRDTAGTLSLMGLNEPMVKSLLINAGQSIMESDSFIDCLLDWQDSDDFKRLNGGESLWYEEQELPLPRNTKIQSLSELEITCGFPKEPSIQELLRENLRLYTSGDFNPRFASKDVILATSLASDKKETLVAFLQQGQEEKASDFLKGNQSGPMMSDFQISNNLIINVQVERHGVYAKREVVFSYRLRYKPRPLIQYWHWSE
ncbi:type II secretion system minor pseudopilin [Pseudoalteromonas sp. GB56]